MGKTREGGLTAFCVPGMRDALGEWNMSPGRTSKLCILILALPLLSNAGCRRGLLLPGRGMAGTMGRDIFDPFFVPATVRLRENQTVCVTGIVLRQEKPGVRNTETIV